jgi:Rhodopirellula transposase DDE domain
MIRTTACKATARLEEGDDHPDRDAQFRHINAHVKTSLAVGTPVISVDTKKKELIGNYVNGGQQWLPAKRPVPVNGHDFPHLAVPRAFPYGIYDLGRNTGFVNVGTDHDTGAFAVASIRGWWRFEGRSLYPKAREIVITADGGESTGHGCGYGNWSCRSWRMRPVFRSRSVTFHPEQASGTRLSIGCFAAGLQLPGVR